MEGRGHLRGAGHTWERKGVAGRSSQEQLSGVTQPGGRDSKMEAPWTAGCGVGKDEGLQSDSCREMWGQSVLSVLCSRLMGCLGAELVEEFLTCLRGEKGHGKIITFLAHTEICYVSSITVNKEMVIS